MTPIQFVLIFALVVIAILYFNRLRTRLWDRVIFFALAIAGIVMVAQPDLANAIAHFFGVGRGVDLLVYLGFIGLVFLWLGLYSRQREMDIRLTQLARHLAIYEAKKPKKKSRSKQ